MWNVYSPFIMQSYLLIGCHLCPDVTQVVMEISGSAAAWVLAWGHEELREAWTSVGAHVHVSVHLRTL